MSEYVIKFENERPDSKFQTRFKVNEEFYSARYVKNAVLECFPQGKKPFDGLEYIQLSEDIEKSRLLTQRNNIPREAILEEMIPESWTLENGTEIHIFEAQRYMHKKERYERRYGMMLEATDCGYIVNCFW